MKEMMKRMALITGMVMILTGTVACTPAVQQQYASSQYLYSAQPVSAMASKAPARSIMHNSGFNF